jgi:transposase-like protein
MRHFPQPFAPAVFSGWLRSRIFPMGKRSYRRYEAAFKSQLIEQIQSGQLSASEAAREHRIPRSLISRWRDQYLGKGLVEKPSIRERQLEAENAKLKAKVADLVMEMDHIKKLQAWVQQKRSADTSVITSKNLDQYRKPAK